LRLICQSKTMLDKTELSVIKSVGSRLKSARELCQPLTITKAAAMLGVSQSYLAALENGIDFQKLPLELILKAAKIYDVSTDFLFGLVGDDWELCPEVRLQREFGQGARELYLEDLAKLGLELMSQQRRLAALTDTVLQLLPAIAEVCESLESFQKRNAGFDEMAGGNQLLYRVKKVRRLGNISKRRFVRVKILPMSEMPDVE
jgi:transcriptional regulator with XRE-family HTH domain